MVYDNCIDLNGGNESKQFNILLPRPIKSYSKKQFDHL